MKKTFQLKALRKDDARVRDKVRHEVNKCVNRTLRQEPPAGFTMWEFNGKIGTSAETAEVKTLKEIGVAIDTLAAAGALEVYIEIEAVPGHRKPSAGSRARFATQPVAEGAGGDDAPPPVADES